MIPLLSPSTIKAVNAFPGCAFGFGSVLASTKNHLASPPPVIQALLPFSTYESPQNFIYDTLISDQVKVSAFRIFESNVLY